RVEASTHVFPRCAELPQALEQQGAFFEGRAQREVLTAVGPSCCRFPGHEREAQRPGRDHQVPGALRGGSREEARVELEAPGDIGTGDSNVVDTNGHAADSMRSGAHEGAAPPAMGPRAGPSRAGHVPLRGGVPGAYRNRATFLGGWARQSYGMRVDRGSGRERRRAGPRRSVGASTQAIVATTPSFSTSVA